MAFSPRPRRITVHVVNTGEAAHWEAALWEYSYVDDASWTIVKPQILSVPRQERGFVLGEVLRLAVDKGPIVASAFAQLQLPPAPGAPTWLDW